MSKRQYSCKKKHGTCGQQAWWIFNIDGAVDDVEWKKRL